MKAEIVRSALFCGRWPGRSAGGQRRRYGQSEGDCPRAERTGHLGGQCRTGASRARRLVVSIPAVLMLLVAAYFFVAPPIITEWMLADSGLRTGDIPEFVWSMHRRLTPRLERWAVKRVASGVAGHLNLYDVPSTEWPMFSCVYYLWTTEALQEAWQRGGRGGEAPAVYARSAIEAARALIMDPVHHWQDRGWARGFREYPRDREGSEWTYDVDAGPILAGFSPAANAFGVAAARANGRMDHAYALSCQVIAACWRSLLNPCRNPQGEDGSPEPSRGRQGRRNRRIGRGVLLKNRLKEALCALLLCGAYTGGVCACGHPFRGERRSGKCE